jgi:ribonuclease P protein component
MTEMPGSKATQIKIDWSLSRLRKHAEYQRVYQTSRKQFAKQMSYFYALRPSPIQYAAAKLGVRAQPARVGLTVGKAMGKAVERNRIKRRMREAVRRQIPLLQAPVDLVLHPKRSVLDLDFTTLEREVADVFRTVQKAARKNSDAPASKG